MLQAVRILAIAAIGRAPRRLHIGGAPWLGADRTQEGRRMKRAGAHFHVIRLRNDAPFIAPIALKFEDQRLKSRCGICSLGHDGRFRRAGFESGRSIAVAPRQGHAKSVPTPEWRYPNGSLLCARRQRERVTVSLLEVTRTLAVL